MFFDANALYFDEWKIVWHENSVLVWRLSKCQSYYTALNDCKHLQTDISYRICFPEERSSDFRGSGDSPRRQGWDARGVLSDSQTAQQHPGPGETTRLRCGRRSLWFSDRSTTPRSRWDDKAEMREAFSLILRPLNNTQVQVRRQGWDARGVLSDSQTAQQHPGPGETTRLRCERRSLWFSDHSTTPRSRWDDKAEMREAFSLILRPLNNTQVQVRRQGWDARGVLSDSQTAQQHPGPGETTRLRCGRRSLWFSDRSTTPRSRWDDKAEMREAFSLILRPLNNTQVQVRRQGWDARGVLSDSQTTQQHPGPGETTRLRCERRSLWFSDRSTTPRSRWDDKAEMREAFSLILRPLNNTQVQVRRQGWDAGGVLSDSQTAQQHPGPGETTRLRCGRRSLWFSDRSTTPRSRWDDKAEMREAFSLILRPLNNTQVQVRRQGWDARGVLSDSQTAQQHPGPGETTRLRCERRSLWFSDCSTTPRSRWDDKAEMREAFSLILRPLNNTQVQVRRGQLCVGCRKALDSSIPNN